MTVTDVRPMDKRRSKVYLDESFAFALYQGELEQFGIEVGKELEEELYEHILTQLLPRRARECALYYLKTRDRTEAEVRGKLRENAYPPSVCDDVLLFLKEYHYVDDEAFALRYVLSHQERKSQKKLYFDLLAKGIAESLLLSVLDEHPCDEEAQIQSWLEKKHLTVANMDRNERQKAMQALARKGYSWDRILRIFRCNT
ncbi:MAG: regulatory protein RecX [bacterium]|nr:regulatory protein RecX [bacterium]